MWKTEEGRKHSSEKRHRTLASMREQENEGEEVSLLRLCDECPTSPGTQ